MSRPICTFRNFARPFSTTYTCPCPSAESPTRQADGMVTPRSASSKVISTRPYIWSRMMRSGIWHVDLGQHRARGRIFGFRDSGHRLRELFPGSASKRIVTRSPGWIYGISRSGMRTFTRIRSVRSTATIGVWPPCSGARTNAPIWKFPRCYHSVIRRKNLRVRHHYLGAIGRDSATAGLRLGNEQVRLGQLDPRFGSDRLLLERQNRTGRRTLIRLRCLKLILLFIHQTVFDTFEFAKLLNPIKLLLCKAQFRIESLSHRPSLGPHGPWPPDGRPPRYQHGPRLASLQQSDC